VPVNVAVEEPRAGIVGEETNRDIIPSLTNTHYIPNNGVVKVVGRVTSAADHMEVVAMQMNRMLSKDTGIINLALFLPQFANTYRSTDGTSRNGQLNTLVWIETVDAACRQEIRRFLCTTQDLEQDGDTWGFKANAVNLESCAGSILILIFPREDRCMRIGERYSRAQRPS
jgi:hypothetical protein